MKYWLALLFIFSIGALAKDADQEITQCGEYQLAGKLDCLKEDLCSLIIDPEKLSPLKILIDSNQMSLSYFHQNFIKAKVKIFSKEPRGIFLTPPTQQVSAFKKSYIQLIKEGTCQ